MTKKKVDVKKQLKYVEEQFDDLKQKYVYILSKCMKTSIYNTPYFYIMKKVESFQEAWGYRESLNGYKGHGKTLLHNHKYIKISESALDDINYSDENSVIKITKDNFDEYELVRLECIYINNW